MRRSPPPLTALLVAAGLFVALSTAGLCGACAEPAANPGDPAVSRPEGWDPATHEKGQVDASIFDVAEVRRLDLEIAPADWQAMVDDLTELLGPAGQGGGGGGGGGGAPPGPPPGPPPEELILACDALAAGTSCSAMLDGNEISGTCTDIGGGTVLCAPEGGPGGPDPGGEGFAREPLKVEATLRYQGGVWTHVGVRFKGNSTLMTTWQTGNEKMPFRLNLDTFEDTYPEIEDQRFYGFKKLALNNGGRDETASRDVLAARVFRAAGVPTPRANWVRLYVDRGDGAEYLGLYALVEDPEGPFLDEEFGDDSGTLYKPEGEGARFAQYVADDFVDENGDGDGSDVERLVDALHAERADAAAWRAGIEATLDVDGFLLWLATNTLVQDWDTYGNMTHNFYLYGAPDDDGRLQWIPWDHNEAFVGGAGGVRPPLSLALDEVGEDWPLIRSLIDDAEYRERYRAALATAAQAFSVEAFDALVEQAETLATPALVGAEGERPESTFVSSEASLAQGFDALRAHVRARQDALATELAAE